MRISIIHNRPKLETIQLAISSRMDKSIHSVVIPLGAIMQKGEGITATCNNVDKLQK